MSEDLDLLPVETSTAEAAGPALTPERRARILKVLLARAEGKGIVAACEVAGIVRQTWYDWERAGLVRQILTDEKGEVATDISALIVSQMREMVQSMVDLVKNGSNESARVKAFQVLSEFFEKIQAGESRDITDFFTQYADKYGPVRQQMPQVAAQVNIAQVNVYQGHSREEDGEIVEGESSPVGES